MYLHLWDLVDGFTLQQYSPDQHIWRFTRSGHYTSKSGYELFFSLALLSLRHAKEFGNLGSPTLFFFLVWPTINHHCWTADRLSKHGHPHPGACPLCDQAEETIQHLFVSCVFARQIWALILQMIGLALSGRKIRSCAIVANLSMSCFSNWWYRAPEGVS